MIELNFGMTALVIFLGIIVLVLMHMNIFLVFFSMGALCLYFLMPRPMLNQLGPAMWSVLFSFPLTSVVLFVLMGELLLHGGISEDLYNCMEKWLQRLPGGLAQVNIAACSLFAAITGSSVSCAATMGVIGGPEMERRGYDNRLTYGSLGAGGTLGILIPPSIPMILYGALTETSVGKLFMAGVVPGILATLLFMTFSGVWALKSPSIVPHSHTVYSWKNKLDALRDLTPTLILIFAILGGIYGGVVTPTEAAAVGALVALVLVAARRKLTWSVLKKTMMSTLYVSSMSMMILAGSSIISFALSYLKVPQDLSEWVAQLGLSRYLVYSMVCIMYLILGMFIDGISMLIVTVPAIVPLLTGLGFDPVWIGIFIVIEIEVALLTPPVGVNLYVLQGVSEKATFGEIALGAVPYVGILILMLIILAAFPQLALWLPSTM
jgi:C4-dicarboxylate transporter DctM subunit